MSTMYIRNFSFRDSLSDEEAFEELKFLTNEVIPAIEKADSVKSVKLYSGAGALRAQLQLMVEMENAAGYEHLLTIPDVRAKLGRLYKSWDLNTATQNFVREVTSDLLGALSST